MNEDRFVYVEATPPLSGKERQRDYKRQHHAWRYTSDAAYREYKLDWRARRRARVLAVAREYGATLAVLLGLAVGGGARAEEEHSSACPGPSLEQLVTEIGPADRYSFRGDGVRPFLQLWRSDLHGPLPVEPDTITVISRPEQPLLVVYARTGCALGLLKASRPDVFAALRASMGEAI